MPELNDFLKHLKAFYKTEPAPDAEKMTAFIRQYALEKNESYTYELPTGGAFQVGGATDRANQPKHNSKTVEKLAQLLCEVNAKLPPQPCIKLTPTRGETTVFDSKLGGAPYLPKGTEYPRVREGRLAGKPLRLLAQLNFDTLPKLPGFPESGILQFFAGCDGDDMVGVDYGDGFNRNGFRVIYHEQVISDVSQLVPEEEMPQFDPEDYSFPFQGEYLLKPSQPALFPATTSDFRFEAAVVECFNRLFGEGSITALWSGKDGGIGLNKLDKHLCDALYDSCTVCGSRIGGYPFFTQEDPRYDERYSGCDTLLFQLDSVDSEDNDEVSIVWGDYGVGAFFINSDHLKRRDFSRVLYSWDCC